MKMSIVPDYPHFMLERMPKVVLDRPHFVLNLMSKLPDRPYFVSDNMLFRSKVLDRLHFVLDRMLSRECFDIHFTFFFFALGVFVKNVKFEVKVVKKTWFGGTCLEIIILGGFCNSLYD
ncbi:hypothetical protein AMTRI_Chr12g274570 [Amborella trichopoda]